MGYEAFVLTDSSRQQLKERFPPKYPEWIGHHVTFRFGVGPLQEPYELLMYQQLVIAGYEQDRGHTGIHVIGHTEDDGIEVLVCTLDGDSRRLDGKTYHITWSLDRSKGWKPADSNRVIAERGTTTPVDPIPIHAIFDYLK